MYIFMYVCMYVCMCVINQTNQSKWNQIYDINMIK